jgi:hypothetical protein
MLSRHALMIAALIAAGLAAAAAVGPTRAAEPPVFTGLVKGVAVGGYDPVAYFREGKPVKGREDLTIEHEGVRWRFASEANRDAFKAEPANFAPQYGGYCAWAVSRGYTAKGDPNAWSVVDGRLYLNYDVNVRRDWLRDVPGNIRKGDANWPKVLAK